MTTENNESSAFRRLLGVLWRVALVLVLGIALGLAAYLGVPLAYRGVVEPPQLNADKIDSLEGEVELSRSETEGLRELVGEQLADLAANQLEQRERMADLQAKLESARQEISDRDAELEHMSTRLDVVADAVAGLEVQLATAAAAASKQDLKQELSVTQTLLYLVRARLWLLESNIGLARVEVQRARSLLNEIDPSGDSQRIQAAIGRLDLTLEELEKTPLVAADDIEIAWKLLVGEDTEEAPADLEG